MISEAIACVGRLKGLWISDNCLKSLPLALAKVKTLEVLDVEESVEFILFPELNHDILVINSL